MELDRVVVKPIELQQKLLLDQWQTYKAAGASPEAAATLVLAQVISDLVRVTAMPEHMRARLMGMGI